MTHSRRDLLTQIAVLAAGGRSAADELGGAVQLNDVKASTSRGFDDVTAYGAKGDGKTDATLAIEKTIRAAHTRKPAQVAGGIVFFPPGVYLVSRAIMVPSGITLQGVSPSASRIVQSSESSLPALIVFGEAGKIATYCGTRSIAIDASARSDTTVLLYGPQEGTELAETLAIGARKVAVDVVANGIVGGSNKFVIDRCWIWTQGDAGFAGIRLGAGSGPLSIRDTTVVGTNRTKPVPAGSAGILAIQSMIVADNVNVEYFESHSYLDRSTADIRTPTGFFNTFGISTSAASNNVSIVVTNASFDNPRNAIVDRGSGVTLRYCRSYSNEAYRYLHLDFRRNSWEVGAAKVYQSETALATMGFTSDANTDTGRFKFSRLAQGQWRESAAIDSAGVFGTADSAFDGAHLRLGTYHLWVDASGALRMKNGAPGSDGDGQVISAS